MRTAFWSATAIALAGWLVSAQGARTTLDIYFIDVEGGQATLIVSPTGASMMVDAGWPGFNGRDVDRIAAAAKLAGLSRIDNLVVTHYHADHVGGVPALAAKLPIGTFIDHGPTVEEGAQPAALYRAYLDGQATGRHLVVKPGDSIAVAGLDVRVVSANGVLDQQGVAGRGSSQSTLQRLYAERPGPDRERPFGRHGDRVRPLPDAGSRRSDVEQGARFDVPEQPRRSD